MIALDTNVIVRFLVRDDKKQAAAAAKYIKRRCTDEEPGFINAIVLCETVWVLTGAYSYARGQVADVIEKILRTRQLRVDRAEAAWQALAAYRKHRADFADAYIGKINRQLGAAHTVTFDKSAAKMEEFVLLM